MTSIGILGAHGRMGRAISSAATSAGATIAGGIDRDGAVHGDHPTLAALAAASDVLSTSPHRTRSPRISPPRSTPAPRS